MTDEEIKDRITEHKECCKKLAEEYRQRYNEDRTDKLALNMFYHNVIAYNNYEDILAMIEDRNSMILCFAEPPILTEKTVEVDLNKMAKIEKENAELKAGRPKWHKVADGDLPSEEGGWVCNQDGLPCYYDWSTEQWLDCEGTQIRTTEWCHMPHKE